MIAVLQDTDSYGLAVDEGSGILQSLGKYFECRRTVNEADLSMMRDDSFVTRQIDIGTPVVAADESRLGAIPLSTYYVFRQIVLIANALPV
jgi:hypothetical protein